VQSRGNERRLVLVVGAIVFVDTMFYAAIAPLLPALAHELRLTKLSAGVMTASYPAGMLVASVPGGMLAVRRGPKFTVCAGLTLLAGSTLAFGLLNDAAALDAARFVEGVGGACSWAGGLAWIVAEAPLDRRGALMGSAIGAGIGGALFGPVIGVIASAVGRAATFSAVGVLAVLLIPAARRLRSPALGSAQGVRQLGHAVRNPTVIVGMWLVALPAIASGILGVLGPLRLHSFGAGAVVIGATYLAGTAIEAALSPAIGRYSDRRGRLVPLRLGLAGATAALILVLVPTSAGPLALTLVAVMASLGAFWAPAMAMLSDAADSQRLEQGLAAALMNLAWAAGQIVGAGAGGAAAKAAGDAAAILAAAVLSGGTLLVLVQLQGKYVFTVTGVGGPRSTNNVRL
jgi:MFS family permease